MSKAQTAIQLTGNIVFYLFPALVCVLLNAVIPGFNLAATAKNADAAAVQAASGGYLSYAITAALFLIAMPRQENGFLAKLDKDGRSFQYAAVIASPAPISVATLMLSAFKFTTLATAGFVLSTAYFCWSALIMFLAIRKAISRT